LKGIEGWKNNDYESYSSVQNTNLFDPNGLYEHYCEFNKKGLPKQALISGGGIEPYKPTPQKGTVNHIIL